MKEQTQSPLISPQILQTIQQSTPNQLAELITETHLYPQIQAIINHIKMHQSETIFHSLRKQLQNMLVVHPETIYSSTQFLNIHKLLLIRDLFEQQENMEPLFFQNQSFFVLLAVTKGFLAQNLSIEKISKLKQMFAKNLKKQTSFWGLSHLQSLQNYLSDSSTGYYPVHNQTQHDIELDRFQFFFQFLQTHQGFFPPSAELCSNIFKIMLCLKQEKQRDKLLFSKFKEWYFNDRYHLQTTLKNMKFALQFFKNPFSQKDCLYNPPKSVNSVLEKYNLEQIQSLLSNSCIGMTWDAVSVYNFFVSCIKLGVTESTSKLMIAMIKFCQKRNKYNELIYNFQNNFQKLFIFLKYPQLFKITSKMLKYFLFSPPPQITLYQKFVEKAIPLASTISQDILVPYLNILQILAYLYKDTTNVVDLNLTIDAQITDKVVRLSEQQIKKEIAEYSWKSKPKLKQQNTILQKQSGYKGFTNIGNSCYLNSFLQSLFMNRQFTKGILNVSTLELEREKLKQPSLHGKDQVTISKQIREQMRPLAQLQRLFALLLQSKRSEITALPIRNVSPSQFKNNYQHDSIQFGRLFLDLLYKNKINKIFQGELTTAIQCDGCKQVRERKQIFLDLIVTPQKDQQFLQDTIDSSFQSEIMHDLVCDFCNEKKQNSIKKHFISKFPNYLIISIKRFQYCVAEKKNRKIMSKVQIKPTISIHNQQYDLYSLIIHRGPSPNAGHYFTFSKYSFEPNCKWICHNDSQVTELESYKEVTEFMDNSESDTPYILFFQRKQHILQTKEELMKPIILRKPLEEYVQRDFLQQQKSKQKKLLPLYNPLNFASFFKKDDEDEGDNNHNAPFFNNYIL